MKAQNPWHNKTRDEIRDKNRLHATKSVMKQQNPWQKPTTRNKICDKNPLHATKSVTKTRYTQQNPWHIKTFYTSKSVTKTIYTQQNTWLKQQNPWQNPLHATKSAMKQQNTWLKQQNPRFESHLGYPPLDIHSPFHFYLRRFVNGAGSKGICCDDKFSMCFCIRNPFIRNSPGSEN